MLIGITGQTGSGKSEVARIFQKYGAMVISADAIGREVVEKNPAILSRLARAFGRQILTPSGKLRRRKLGEMAFSSLENKLKLNKIVHPALLKELKSRSLVAQKKYKIVVIDAALLIDWGWQKNIDITILVNAGNRIKIKRLMAKGLSKKEAGRRLKAQLSFSQLKRHSDLLIYNNKSLETLELKVRKIMKKIGEKG